MEWTFQDAQANLETLVDLALKEGPQHVQTDAGEIVILSAATYKLLSKRKPTFIEHLLTGPDLSDLDLSRDQSPEREFEW